VGTRTETKNLNSFRSVEKAVLYEIDRQIGVLEDGGTIVQETRGWDDAGLKTFSQRTKEDAHDYRYMPDPDLPPIVLEQGYVDEIEASMPDLPADYRQMLTEAGIDAKTASDIIAVPETAMTVKRVYEAAGASHAKRVAFWLMQPQSDDATDDTDATEDTTEVNDDQLIKLSQMVEANKLSSTAAKDVLTEVLKTGADPEKVAADKNLLQVSDEGAIAAIVKQVLADNAKAAEDVRGGEMKAIGFLVGQVMKLSQGKANPAMATDLIKKQLGL
jgi:aspartyl-tRNA(Asn)/glutamyl-tRNA(Gln) amidotransferase subunit B